MTTTRPSFRGRPGRSAGAGEWSSSGFWRKLLEHPAYDAFWQDQAMDRVLASRPLKVPVMVVHGLWDQEDIYGAPAVYRALEKQDPANDRVFLVIGPWFHGQQIRDGSALGPIRFRSDTARWFRQEVLRPFLDQYLKEGAPPSNVAPVTAFESGTNVWRRLPAWPAGCDRGCKVEPTPLYLSRGTARRSPRRGARSRRTTSGCRTPRSQCLTGRARCGATRSTGGPGW
jgi:predicted acyl esterase